MIKNDVARVLLILSIVLVIVSKITFLLRSETPGGEEVVTPPPPTSSSSENTSTSIIVLWLITCDTRTTTTGNSTITTTAPTSGGADRQQQHEQQHVDLQNWLWSATTFQQYHYHHHQQQQQHHSEEGGDFNPTIQVRIKNVCESVTSWKCRDCNTKANSIYKFVTTELLPHVQQLPDDDDDDDDDNKTSHYIDINTTTIQQQQQHASITANVSSSQKKVQQQQQQAAAAPAAAAPAESQTMQPQQQHHYIMYTDTDTMFNSYILTPNDIMERYYQATSSLTMNHNNSTTTTTTTTTSPPIPNNSRKSSRKKGGAGGGILFSGEPNCWVGKYCSFKDMVRMYPNTTRSSCPQFVNAGQFMGDAETVGQMLHDIIHYSSDEFHGTTTSDQARLHQWYSTHRNTIATIDTNASIFRSLVFGLVDSSHYTSHSYAGLICGGTIKSEHKTCGMYKQPIWGTVHPMLNESNATTSTTKNTTLSSSTTTTAEETTSLLLLPYVKMDVVPTCEYAERIPFSFHGAGPNLKPHLQHLFHEFRKNKAVTTAVL